MKILFYNHTGKISGAERVLLILLSGLGSGYDGVLLCPADGGLQEAVTELGIRFNSIDALAARFTWRPDRLIRYLLSFVSVIRDARACVAAETPDLIHANSIRAALVISAATVGSAIPVVWHVHDLLPRHPLSAVIRAFSWASRRNCIVAVSEAVGARSRGKLLRWFRKRAPVVTIYNGIDLKRFYPNDDSRNHTRRRLGLDDSQVVIGIVGQLTPRKGQLELIEAFANMAADVPNAVLLIVGDAIFNHDEEYKARLVKAADTAKLAGRVRFLGSCDDIPELMRAFDLLVVNSHAEAFGLTAVEAMASETTVLATSVDGLREIIHRGENGWLVPPGDQQRLTDALRRLSSDPEMRCRLRERARLDAFARFSSKRFVMQIQSLYESLPRRSEKSGASHLQTFNPEVISD